MKNAYDNNNLLAYYLILANVIAFGMAQHKVRLFCKGQLHQNSHICKVYLTLKMIHLRIEIIILRFHRVMKNRVDCVDQLTVDHYDRKRPTSVLQIESWLTKMVTQSFDKHNQLFIWRTTVDSIDHYQSTWSTVSWSTQSGQSTDCWSFRLILRIDTIN